MALSNLLVLFFTVVSCDESSKYSIRLLKKCVFDRTISKVIQFLYVIMVSTQSIQDGNWHLNDATDDGYRTMQAPSFCFDLIFINCLSSEQWWNKMSEFQVYIWTWNGVCGMIRKELVCIYGGEPLNHLILKNFTKF